MAPENDDANGDHSLTGSGVPANDTGLPPEEGDTASEHDQGADGDVPVQPGQGADAKELGVDPDPSTGHVPGSGAAGDDTVLGDGGNAAAEATTDDVLGEPTSIGFVEQDNVTEPGVQRTHNRIDGTNSTHGEPEVDDVEALDEEPVVTED